MELLALHYFTDHIDTIKAGQTTHAKRWDDVSKCIMLQLYPEWFERIEDDETVLIEIPEAKFFIETPEARLPTIRKK